MRRYATALSVSLLTFFVALAAFAAAYAQKKAQPASKPKDAVFTPLKDSASLDETLSWLNDNLVRYGKFTVYQPLYEPGYRSRTRFLGLEAQGCVVTYKVKEEVLRAGDGNVIQAPNDDIVRGPNGEATRAVSGNVARSRNNYQPLLSHGRARVEVRTLDLAALDSSLVKANAPEKWDGGSVLFGAGHGNIAVSYKDGRGKLMQYDGGEFYVSDKERVEAIAGALRHAVALCKK